MDIKSKILNRVTKKLTKGPITRVQLAQYAGASGDFNPIHIDEVFAKHSPHGGVVAHGMLSMGFLGQYLDQIAGDDGDVKQFRVRFQSIVRPGDTLTCASKIKEVNGKQIKIDLKASNQKEETIIIGEALISAK